MLLWPLAILLVVTVSVAESVGLRLEIYSGACCGLLIGATGMLFSRAIARRHEASRAVQGRWDVWRLWGAGFLVRLVLMGAFSLALFQCLGAGAPAALLSLTAIYLVSLFWDAGVLCRQLAATGAPAGTIEHG
ncbi:MAG: hypothetical protein M5U26_14040 [Planctomycetota bacterium]|nr:hypothetical protein [Planctomycetota bacterium]